MNQKIHFILLFFYVLFSNAEQKTAQESFIVQSKPQRESRSKIQNDIASSLLSNAKKNPFIIEQASYLERRILDQGDWLMVQEKHKSVDNQKLQEYRSAHQKVSSILDQCNNLLHEAHSLLHEAYTKLDSSTVTAVKK